jgi:enoyl-[acyl-carrier protein] reductase I
MNTPTGQVMAQHKVLVVGIANEHSIAYGCARAFRELGAELAITYLNDKAKSYVEPLAQELGASCHSFIRMARLAAPLMDEGGSLFAMSYLGATRVVPNYDLMGPVKAALEASCRYLAHELGPKRIRVHPISPGPLKTRAASGLKDFDLLLAEAAERAPIGELVDIMDVGYTCAFLATPYARRMTGNTVFVDGGVSIIG